jgi:hypothetical protein
MPARVANAKRTRRLIGDKGWFLMKKIQNDAGLSAEKSRIPCGHQGEEVDLLAKEGMRSDVSLLWKPRIGPRTYRGYVLERSL